MKIVIVNGAPHCGKTLFEALCDNAMPHRTYTLSSVDKVKEIARNCGWNGDKTPSARKFLSELKRILVEFNDLPYYDIEHKIDQIAEQHDYSYGEPIIFVDVREPSEIKKFVDRMEAKTLLIRRPQGTDVISNAADANVEKFEYDYYVMNDGTINDFNVKAQLFLRAIFENED